jgi:quinoprotein glucose dehydrogenase
MQEELECEMSKSRLVSLGLVAAFVVATSASVYVQTPIVPPTEMGDVMQLPPEEARQAAEEARKAAAIQLADGLEVSVWATGHLVADTFPIDLDPYGAAYVGATPRGSQWLDTRQHPDWVPELHRLKTTEDLRQFFREKMATELSDQNTWITDFNNDGIRDYRDLMGVPERIYKVEDTDGDGVADKSTVVFSGFNEDIAADILGGIMVHESGDIYATIAPDLWRLRDTDGDGLLDFKESLSHGYSVHPSFSGHDMSALTQGPDGMIYWKIGEIGMNVVDRNGKRWAHPHTGAVLRANPDGSDFEVFAYGVRNPQEIAFDEYGNLISADNDGDYPTETERIIYIAEGSDTGWRSTWQFGKYTDPDNNRYNVWMDEGLSRVRWEGQAAYITPPLAPFAAGPSGFAYNPGTALDPSWKNHFFVTSYTGNAANARIFAFTITPKGAGFEVSEPKQIVQGILSPGMAIGPDGAIYLTDFIRGWGPTGEGRLWKLDSTAGKGSAIRAEVHELLKADFGQRDAAALRGLFLHEDMRVRLKAQFELVRRGESAVLSAAATEQTPQTKQQQLARIHGIWGLGQLLRSKAVAPSMVRPLLGDGDPEIRAQAAKVLGHARAVEAADALMPLVSDENARVRYFSTIALGRMGHREAMPAIVSMLAGDNEQDVYLRSAAVTAFEAIGDRQALNALSTHPSRGVRLAAVVALRRLKDAGVARFLDDVDPLVVTEAARAINDEGGILEALPALARVLERPTIEGEPLVRRALSANLRIGDAAAVERVAAYAQRAGVPEALLVESLAILGVWAAPSNLDRVDGSWIAPLPQREASAAEAALERLASVGTAPGTPVAARVAWVEAVARLRVKSQAPAILARLREDADAGVRVAALRALQALEATELADGVEVAMADSSTDVRMAAIGAMADMPLPAAEKVEHLTAVIGRGDVGEQQSAIAALGDIGGAEANAALGQLADRLAAGQIPAGAQLDVLEALRESGDAQLADRLEALKVGRDLSGVAAAFPEALAVGGNANRGREVVTQHEAAQCARCHLGGAEAGQVGPPLDKIGATLSRQQLLEALLEPSARIAPGFGTVSIRLNNGTVVEGTLREESATTVTVEDGTGALRQVPVADIAERTNGVSAMPPMGLLLTPQEIRDAVEFLSTLR